MSVFAHKNDKSKFNLGNESDLSGIGDGTAFNAIKSVNAKGTVLANISNTFTGKTLAAGGTADLYSFTPNKKCLVIAALENTSAPIQTIYTAGLLVRDNDNIVVNRAISIVATGYFSIEGCCVVEANHTVKLQLNTNNAGTFGGGYRVIAIEL